MNAFVKHKHGGPEVLSFEDAAISRPKTDEVQVRRTTIGLNFIAVYFRTSLYAAPAGLPLISGSQGAGIAVVTGCNRFYSAA